MKNKKSNTPSLKRRKLLVGASTGSLAAWSAPIITSIITPAHAQTSPMPSFSVEKVQSGGPNPVTVAGDVLEYTITVTNTGNSPLTGVVATDTLPDGTVVILSDPAESVTTDGVLGVGEQWVYVRLYTASVDDVSGAALINVVSVAVDGLSAQQVDSADTPVTPAQDLCSMVVTGNTVFGPVSGSSVPPVCSMTFDVLSGTAGAPLTIVSVTNNALPADNTITYDTFGEATEITGPRVVWRGPASDAPFCSDLMPIDQNDITFTVTATCAAAGGREFTQSFTLADVLA